MKPKETIFFLMAYALAFATSEQNLSFGSLIVCIAISLILFFFAIPEDLRKSAAHYYFVERKQKGGKRRNG